MVKYLPRLYRGRVSPYTRRLVVITIIILLCVITYHQAFITVSRATNSVINAAKTVLPLMLGGRVGGGLVEQTVTGWRRTRPRGPYSEWATWVPHLCPHHQVRGTAPPGLNLTWEPPTEHTIFFTQTSCTSTLTPREACAVESAAHHHPGRPLLLLLTSPALNHTHPLMQVLVGLDGVRVAWLDLDRVLDQPSLHTWHTNRQWMINPERAAAFVSDVVREELLRRYGGTYLDLDVIILRPLPLRPLSPPTHHTHHPHTYTHQPPENWLAWVDHRLVNLAISSFTKGHWLLESVIEDIPRVYDPAACCSVGPELVTHHLRQHCPHNFTGQPLSGQPHLSQALNSQPQPNQTHPSQPLTGQVCLGTTVYPSALFYPVHYGYGEGELKSIFREGAGLGETFFSTTRAFTLHHYNSLSVHALVSPAGDSILKEAFRRNCPRIFHLLAEANIFF